MKKYLLIIFLMSGMILSNAAYAETGDRLSWQDCIAIAKKNHPDLISAEEKVNQAKASAGITRSAMLPSINASAEAAKTKSSPGTSSNTYSYGVSGQQLLFDSGKTYYDLKSAEKQVNVYEYNYKVVSATIRQSLRYSFIKLLSAQESLIINTEIAKIRKRNMELVRMRYSAGLEHKGSLLTAEANMAMATYLVSNAERNIVFEQGSLLKDMGIENFKPYSAIGDMTIPVIYDAKPDYEALSKNNPQLKEIIEKRIAAEYSVTSSKLDYSPKIYGVLSAERIGNNWPPADTQYSASVQATLNFFQGGNSYYTTQQAKATYKQLFSDEKSTHNTIVFYLQQAWTNLQNTMETVRVQQIFLNAAEERARIADGQYSIGSLAFDSWTIIQDNLVNAKQNFINAEMNALLAEADWIQAQGGTLDYDK